MADAGTYTDWRRLGCADRVTSSGKPAKVAIGQRGCTEQMTAQKRSGVMCPKS